jgi:hypothetical protein
VLDRKSERRAAFDAWLAKVVEPHVSTWLVVLDGNRWVAGGELHTATDEPLRLDDVGIDAICASTIRPTLPADLPAP